MLYFASDYLEGAHPNILQRLLETNLEKTSGYGEDRYSQMAKEKIRQVCGCPEAEIYFLIGGTQTNATVIKALLRVYEGVLSPETGHINLHEAGAVEASGHKVLALPQKNGKISATDTEKYLENFYQDDACAHMVSLGMVYISFPTEYGTLYSLQELQDLHSVCKRYHLPLFIDGARMGYGLAASSDLDLEKIAQNCEVFTIGGTKVGALFGEAVVLTQSNLIPHFFTIIKQQGALLAKGRITGLQFDTLFTDNLYLTIAKHAVRLAQKLKQAMLKKGYTLYLDSPTNQQFFVMKNAQLKELADHVSFSNWEAYDSEHTVIRLATSWATEEKDVDELLRLL